MKKIKSFCIDSLNHQESICFLILVMMTSGIMGFLYEEVFYRIDLGYFVKRGSTFGPWIPIYVFGGFFLILLTYPFRKKPLLVFFLSLLVTGVLEYATGFVFFHFFHMRLWDYNTEIWNFGNINGYICLRSVLLFGLAGLFLIYVLSPFLIRWIPKVSSKKLSIVCTCLISLFFFDMVLYTIFHNFLNLLCLNFLLMIYLL